MMKQTAILLSSKLKLFLIMTLTVVVCLIMSISIVIITKQEALPQTTARTFAPNIRDQSFLSKDSFTSPSDLSSTLPINNYMRTIYDELNNSKRKKRQLSNSFSTLSLSNDIDSIVSLSNQHNHDSNSYHFQYNSSLENLTHVELILPVKQLTRYSTIELKSNQFNLLLKHPFQLDQNWLKINLTQYIQSFPVTFFIQFKRISIHSSPFLTLHFQRSLPLHSITRRDISSFEDDNQLVTYPNNPFDCQVRPLRTSFSELNWTSRVLEPSSYEMNICSGVCHTDSKMPSYLIMQNLLHRMAPKKIPTLCCKPKRFSSTILLYYEGSNLILKRYDNMRVVECGCS